MIIKWLSTKYINQSDLLTLTVGCEKRSCLIRSQKKKKKKKRTDKYDNGNKNSNDNHKNNRNRK